MQKRMRIMGRGRTGVGYRRWTHVTIKVEKIDFQREIDDAINPIMRKKWQMWHSKAEKMKAIKAKIASLPPDTIKV